jgi:hypothetical protein
LTILPRNSGSAGCSKAADCLLRQISRTSLSTSNVSRLPSGSTPPASIRATRLSSPGWASCPTSLAKPSAPP